MTIGSSPLNLQDVLDAIDISAGKQIGVDVRAIEPDQNLFDLGLTSIGFISMIVEFEERYDVVFEEDELDLTEFNTLRVIQMRLEKKLNATDDAKVGAVMEG